MIGTKPYDKYSDFSIFEIGVMVCATPSNGRYSQLCFTAFGKEVFEVFHTGDDLLCESPGAAED